MERRKALAVAATITGTLAAGAAAMAVNFGLLGAQPSSAGKLDARNVSSLTDDSTPATTSPDVQVIYQDIPVPSSGTGGGSGSGGGSGYSQPAPASSPSAGPTYSDDTDDVATVDDDDGYEHRDDEHEDRPEVHEGEQDDD